MLPTAIESSLHRVLPRLQADPRLDGVAAAGSWITDELDEFSDLDLIVVVKDSGYDEVMRAKLDIVLSMGDALSAFTGEHVGEPRLVIGLFDNPLLHIDFKFITLADLEDRTEDPVVLWERDGALSAAMAQARARPTQPDVQWMEERFWVWIHYAATKLGRGELFETLDFLSFLRAAVLGPLTLSEHGGLPRGVRRLEAIAPHDLERLEATVAAHDHESCGAAVRAAIEAYRDLRDRLASPDLVRHADTERAAVAYLDEVLA